MTRHFDPDKPPKRRGRPRGERLAGARRLVEHTSWSSRPRLLILPDRTPQADRAAALGLPFTPRPAPGLYALFAIETETPTAWQPFHAVWNRTFETTTFEIPVTRIDRDLVRTGHRDVKASLRYPRMLPELVGDPDTWRERVHRQLDDAHAMLDALESTPHDDIPHLPGPRFIIRGKSWYLVLDDARDGRAIERTLPFLMSDRAGVARRHRIEYLLDVHAEGIFEALAAAWMLSAGSISAVNATLTDLETTLASDIPDLPSRRARQTLFAGLGHRLVTIGVVHGLSGGMTLSAGAWLAAWDRATWSAESEKEKTWSRERRTAERTIVAISRLLASDDAEAALDALSPKTPSAARLWTHDVATAAWLAHNDVRRPALDTRHFMPGRIDPRRWTRVHEMPHAALIEPDSRVAFACLDEVTPLLDAFINACISQAETRGWDPSAPFSESVSEAIAELSDCHGRLDARGRRYLDAHRDAITGALARVMAEEVGAGPSTGRTDYQPGVALLTVLEWRPSDRSRLDEVIRRSMTSGVSCMDLRTWAVALCTRQSRGDLTEYVHRIRQMQRLRPRELRYQEIRAALGPDDPLTRAIESEPPSRMPVVVSVLETLNTLLERWPRSLEVLAAPGEDETIAPGYTPIVELAPDLTGDVRRLQYLQREAGQQVAPSRALRRIVERPMTMRRELEHLTRDTGTGAGGTRDTGTSADATRDTGTHTTSARIAAIRAALVDTTSLREGQARDLRRRLDETLRAAEYARVRAALRRAIAERYSDLTGRTIAPNEPLDSPLAHAIQLSMSITGNRRALRRLLQSDGNARVRWIREHPDNVRFLSRLEASGVDVDEWLRGFDETVELRGHRLRVYVEDRPLHALRMGSLFGTCLGEGEFNAHAAVANVVDLNKRVVYLEHERTVIGRKLVCVAFRPADDGSDEIACLLGYTVYGSLRSLGGTRRHPRVAEVVHPACRRWADRCGLVLVHDETLQPDPLVAKEWYDDGVIDWTSPQPVFGGQAFPHTM